MLTSISAGVTLVNLLLSVLVGARLLRLARRSGGFGPEFWLGLFFLFAAFLGSALNIVVYAGLADPALRLSGFYGSLLLASSCFAYIIGATGLYTFTWLTFRHDSARARFFVAAAGALLIAAACAQALTEGFAVRVLPGVAYWCFFGVRVAPYLWVGVESLRYHASARRRLRLGLADAVVTNRFLLLGLWGLAWVAMSFAEVAARALYVLRTGNTVELRLETAGPIILATVAATSALGVIGAVTLGLCFFPTPAYRRFLERRARARRA
jgi:hypothetical protein